jgi:hypothetical protein
MPSSRDEDDHQVAELRRSLLRFAGGFLRPGLCWSVPVGSPRVGPHRAQLQRFVDLFVVAVDAKASDDDERHEQDDQPRAMRELGHRRDQQHERRHEGTGGVDGDAPAPVAVPMTPPMGDHAGLGEREGEEDSDRVQRDQ